MLTIIPSCIVLFISLFYALLFNKRILVICSPIGNLGNRLFLFSNFISFATENNFEVVNPAFYEFADYFETTSIDFFCRYPPHKTIHLKNALLLRRIFLKLVYYAATVVKKMPKNNFFQTFDLENLDERLNLDREGFVEMISGKRVIFFRGWLFVDRINIVKHADRVREYFVPQKYFKESIDFPIKSLKKSCNLLLGIVVRQGDYKTWFDGKYFYNVDIYVQIMQQLKNLFSGKNVGFFICSDVELDTRKFSDFNFIFRSKHDLENRYSLAQCDYILSVPSTYGGWAAFYGHVPLCILSSPEQVISLADFKTIDNHTDLRDPNFSSDIDITDFLIRN